MHEAQAEWVLRQAPSPDLGDFADEVDLPGQAPDAAAAPPHPPAPPATGTTTPTAAASAPPLLRIIPISDSPASPEPEAPEDDLDETHLIVWATDDETILLVSPSPPRPLGRLLARLVPPRLPPRN